ncbi:glycine zipper family protein [Synechocystis sp. LKSZ1]|uniref:glycine zipper family protein n=1 Tax=Synechocystis sp. LKSZ1 TaxID=3144951 RepID=UPI00336C2D93
MTLFLCSIEGMALAQTQLPEPFAYPTKGQTQEQQQQDHFACYSWAKQQTGVDPSQLSPMTTAQSSQQGQMVQGAARGSLLGVVGGAIGGNVGEGAAIGAGVGALTGLFRRREEQQQQAQAQAQLQAAEQQQLANYYRAWTTCMQGRGYTVN